jgi:ketosteroid isomerase-like protein
MKIRFSLALVALAFGFTVPTFAQQKDTVDPKTDQQIRVLAAKYDEAINRRDAAAVATLYSQDGVWVTNSGNCSKSFRSILGGFFARTHLPRSVMVKTPRRGDRSSSAFFKYVFAHATLL